MAEGLREDMTEPNGGRENQPNNNNGEFLSIPRGGPLYIANPVGSITSIPYFETSLLLELKVSIYPFVFIFDSFFMFLDCLVNCSVIVM